MTRYIYNQSTFFHSSLLFLAHCQLFSSTANFPIFPRHSPLSLDLGTLIRIGEFQVAVYLDEVQRNTNKPLWEQIMATTTKREQVSFKLESNTKQRLEALAAATRRTRTFVLEEAVNQYLNLNEWQLKSIEAGLEDAKAGRVIDSETLLKKWEKRVEDSLD